MLTRDELVNYSKYAKAIPYPTDTGETVVFGYLNSDVQSLIISHIEALDKLAICVSALREIENHRRVAQGWAKMQTMEVYAKAALKEVGQDE